MAANSTDYTAAHLSVLEGLDAVRKRPGMYIGSTDGRGLMHCVWELIDNSVDEALDGHCTRIVVTLYADGSVEVADNGRGIPVDTEKKSRLSGLELVMTKLHAGGKFGGGSYAATGGLHGVGASVVNALGARLNAEVDRGGNTHAASFRRGVTGVFAGPERDAGFTKKAGLSVVGSVPRSRTGTRVRWWPDPLVFTSDAALSMPDLLERARQTAYLVPDVTITVRDEREAAQPAESTSDTDEHSFRFKGGIAEFAESLAPDTAVTSVIRMTGSGHFKETVPVLDAKGHLNSQEVERELQVDVAMQWNAGYETLLRSFVNVIATPKGGTHIAGFERAVSKTVNEALRAAKVLRSGEDNVAKDDVFEGLVAVVTVRVPEPQFEGQTKEVLGTPAASRIVANVVSADLGAWFTNPPRGEKNAARAALDKVANAARARLAARQQRDVTRRKNALESSSLPAKLVDCRSSDAVTTELFIVEGDSALGTAKLARDSSRQALLPIRGKILNVQKAGLSDMLKNAECAAIIQVIGAGSGRSFDLDAVRYGKIILMADADVDGAHIRCLLLTLMHRYLAPLLEAGRVFAAVPPLHRIEIGGRGARSGEVIYAYSDAEMQRLAAALRADGLTIKEPIQRFKGLGEMDARQLRETTMHPGHRVLRRVKVSDAHSAAGMFELLMGGEVAPRKEFLVNSAAGISRDAIDV